MEHGVSIITVLFVSPSDVVHHCDKVQREIDEWNRLEGRTSGARAEFLHWTTDAYQGESGRPQETINRQLVDRADIVVASFWHRFGTPTGEAASGTEEEIRRAVKAAKRVLVYFSDEPVRPGEVRSDQYRRLRDFRRRLEKSRLCQAHNGDAAFEVTLRRDVRTNLNDLARSHPQRQSKSQELRFVASANLNEELHALSKEFATLDASILLYSAESFLRFADLYTPGTSRRVRLLSRHWLVERDEERRWNEMCKGVRPWRKYDVASSIHTGVLSAAAARGAEIERRFYRAEPSLFAYIFGENAAIYGKYRAFPYGTTPVDVQGQAGGSRYKAFYYPFVLARGDGDVGARVVGSLLEEFEQEWARAETLETMMREYATDAEDHASEPRKGAASGGDDDAG